MKLTITISAPIPSLNKTGGEHFGSKKRRWEEYKTLISFELIMNYKVKERKAMKLHNRKRVTIHSQRWQLCDYDNLVGGAKVLLDALKIGTRMKPGLGLIVDDDIRWIDDPVYTQSTERPYGTTITIEDIA